MHYAPRPACVVVYEYTSKIQRVFHAKWCVHSIAYIQTRGFNEKDDDIHLIHISLHWYKMLLWMCVSVCVHGLIVADLILFFCSIFFPRILFLTRFDSHFIWSFFSVFFASSSIGMVVSDMAISYLVGSFFIWNSLHCLTPAWNICIHRVRRICDYKYRNNEAVKRRRQNRQQQQEPPPPSLLPPPQ